MHPIIPPIAHIALSLVFASSLTATTHRHEERDGFLEFEAEDFCSQTLDAVRKWYVIRPDTVLQGLQDPDENHAASASGQAYIECLPDTRVTHDDKLIRGENFANAPGQMAVLSYTVKFNTPGRYWVWASAYSTGTEDNGLHVGLNGTWPESGQRLQWCNGKHQWTWSSAQRVEHNHCGFPKTVFLDVPSAGVHTFQISMREDGTEIDRFILVNDRAFDPEGYEPPDPEFPFRARTLQNGSYQLGFDTFALPGRIPYYKDHARGAYAIAANIKDHRKGFAIAESTFDGKEGNYILQLDALRELDGECQYRILLNGELIAQFTNATTNIDYLPERHRSDVIKLKPGDLIAVESMAHTNGKIPEGDETAWARGRWQRLLAIPQP
jgi:hypothetical protein